jgi:hypothetical protein
MDDSSSNNDILEALKMQFSFLNDRFKVYDEVIQAKTEINLNTAVSEVNNKAEEDKPCDSCIRHKYELEEKNKIISSLKDELMEKDDEIRKILDDKDSQIDNLKRQLEMAKFERSTEKRIRPQYNHSHSDSLSTMASLAFNFNNTSDDFERQLVEMKFKYADTCAKLLELEDELKRRNTQMAKLLGMMNRKDLEKYFSLKISDEFLDVNKIDDLSIVEDYFVNLDNIHSEDVYTASIINSNINNTTDAIDINNNSEINNKSFINKVKRFLFY